VSADLPEGRVFPVIYGGTLLLIDIIGSHKRQRSLILRQRKSGESWSRKLWKTAVQPVALLILADVSLSRRVVFRSPRSGIFALARTGHMSCT
jgi:hypothetical protein